MYFLIFISLIILSIFLFYIFKKFNCLKTARYYHKKHDILSKKNALEYYLKYINNTNEVNKDKSVLLDIANLYHYSNKDLFQAVQYYYLYIISVKNKNDILSKKNKLHASNKIKEILEYDKLTTIQTNHTRDYTNQYLLNNILDRSNELVDQSNNSIIVENIVIDNSILHNSILNNINNYLIKDEAEDTVEEIVDDFPIHRPILNDNQNIHDTYVNNTIQNSINNIKTEQNIPNKINLNIDEIKNPIRAPNLTTLQLVEINNIIKDEINKQNFNDTKKNNIIKVLESINTNSTKSYKNDMTLSELLILIFNRIYNKYDEDIQKTFLSNLIIELNDCVENDNIVCHTGIFNRLINSINLLDIEVNIKTYDFLNEEIMNKCIAIRNELETDTPNNDDENNESLKNKIRLEMNKDYINTKILTQNQLDDILNIWIDHI